MYKSLQDHLASKGLVLAKEFAYTIVHDHMNGSTSVFIARKGVHDARKHALIWAHTYPGERAEWAFRVYNPPEASSKKFCTSIEEVLEYYRSVGKDSPIVSIPKLQRPMISINGTDLPLSVQKQDEGLVFQVSSANVGISFTLSNEEASSFHKWLQQLYGVK